MGKRMLTGLLVALACAAAVEARAQGVVRVTAERTSVRETPATDAAVVATVMKNEELDVLETNGAWFKVRVKSAGRDGFVHSLFVELGWQGKGIGRRLLAAGLAGQSRAARLKCKIGSVAAHGQKGT